MLATRTGRRHAAAVAPLSAARAAAGPAAPAAGAGCADPAAARTGTGDGQPGTAPTPGDAAPPPPAPAWREIGRAGPGDALWIAWVAPLGDRGAALYRLLVVADGAIVVSVELQPPPGGGDGARPVHRGRCGAPPPDDARGIEGRAALLLAAADKAVARAVGASIAAGDGPAPARPGDDRGRARQPRA